MGVDLILLPVDYERDGWGFSHTVLGSAEDDEPHYGDTQYDAYGERLHCTTVAALLPLAQHPGVTEAARNRAAWAYLEALPPHTRVALYWH